MKGRPTWTVSFFGVLALSMTAQASGHQAEAPAAYFFVLLVVAVQFVALAGLTIVSFFDRFAKSAAFRIALSVIAVAEAAFWYVMTGGNGDGWRLLAGAPVVSAAAARDRGPSSAWTRPGRSRGLRVRDVRASLSGFCI
jgi:hypothetical protein